MRENSVDRTSDTVADAERQAALVRILSGGGVVLDIGANRGQFARELLATSDVSVICFEPVDAAFDDLCALAHHEPRISPRKLAVATSTGSADFHVQRSDVGSSLLEPLPNQGSQWLTASEVLSVDTTRLDDFMTREGLANISLLKSDSQGYDKRVIESAGAFLNPGCIGAVLVEVNFHQFYRDQDSFSSLLDLMHSSGYFLAGLYRHFNRSGWLWWADVLFLPNEAPFSTNSAI